MKRLNGWHRLWLLACTIYLLVVTAVAFLRFPTRESVTLTETIPFLATSTLLAMQSAKQEEWVTRTVDGMEIQMLSTMDEMQRLAYVQQNQEAVTSALIRKRRDYALVAFLCWVIPCGVAAALGYGFAWVRRGFRAQTAA